MKIDIAKQQNTVDSLNSILSNGGIAEVKLEWSKEKVYNVTVVEIGRKLKTSEKVK